MGVDFGDSRGFHHCQLLSSEKKNNGRQKSVTLFVPLQ